MEEYVDFPFYIYVFKPVLNIFANFANVVFFLGSRWAQLRQTGVIGIYLMFVWCSSIESALVSWRLTRRKKKKNSAHCDQLVRNGQMKWKPPHHCCSSINPPLSRLGPVSERVEWSGGLVRLIRSQTAQEHLCYFKIWMWNGARRWIISFSSLWQRLFLSAPEMIFKRSVFLKLCSGWCGELMSLTQSLRGWNWHFSKRWRSYAKPGFKVTFRRSRGCQREELCSQGSASLLRVQRVQDANHYNQLVITKNRT